MVTGAQVLLAVVIGGVAAAVTYSLYVAIANGLEELEELIDEAEEHLYH